MPKIVPDIISEQSITAVSSQETVQEAAKRMAEKNIAAVVILQDGKLSGIMTERDIAARVVARGLDPSSTLVKTVMTHNPDTLRPDDIPPQALRMMREHGYRHLPVVDSSGKVVGMVSVRDLYAFVLTQLEDDIRERDQYIYGESYGVSQ